SCREIERQLPGLRERLAGRPSLPPERELLARSWQALGAADAGDVTLVDDLGRALSSPDAGPALALARGAGAGPRPPPQRPARAEALRRCAADLHRACVQAPRHALAPLCLVEALALLGQHELAADGARRLLRRLADRVTAEDLDGPLFPPGYSLFRVEWE